ncbi:MAG TPA: DNA internalization-related competence protein ComEC/Rec2 [Polyangiaceae bacterium]|nr:DNA internalization-related competence protein ComEC/Rec2 [Polyangiaceae bacterium]
MSGLVIDVTVLTGLALLGGALVPVSPYATSLAAIATIGLLRDRFSRFVAVLALLFVMVGLLRSASAVRRFDDARAVASGALAGPRRCAATARVLSSPTARRSEPPELFVMAWDADLTEISCDGREHVPNLRARIYGGPDDLARGDTAFVIANLAPAQLFRNDELGDPRPSGARRMIVAGGGTEDVRVVRRGSGIAALIDRLRCHVRRRIEATFVRAGAPMARALVLGESDLEEGDDEAFRASGLSHLLAVSGTHLVLVVVGAVSALTALLRRCTPLAARWDVGRWSAAWGVIFAWIYADFAGGSGSANRAAAMLSFALLARAFGRRPKGPRAFGLSLLAAAAVDPLVVFDLSFALSVAATAGLMVLQPAIAARFRSQRSDAAVPKSRAAVLREKLGVAVATTLSATLGCAPLIALMAPSLPLGGIIANLLAVPVGEVVALPLCLAHAGLGFMPLVERGAALVASGSLLLVRAIALVTASATWLAVPIPRPSAWHNAIMWIACAAMFAAPARRRSIALVAAALLVLCEAFAIRQGAPRDRLRVTVLDVGQGDATLVDFPDGRSMLVDAGGLIGSPIDTGKAVVAPLLRARRRSKLDVVALSHPHPDHFGGLPFLVSRTRMGEFWDTGQGELEGAGPVYAGLLRSLRGRAVPIVRPDALCDRPRSFGKASVVVLSPCPAPVPFANANDNSLIMRVALGERAALLVGDAEHAAEESLLARSPGVISADFLKVGHHGSVTSSSPRFLAAVGASDAAISCGVRNRFGHPHPVALRALLDAGRVYRTDRNGSIAWETDGARTSIHVAQGERAEADRSTGSSSIPPFGVR